MEAGSKETYREFCKTEEKLPIFFQDWYLDAVCQEGRWDAAVVEQTGDVIAVMPYFLKKKAIFQYITVPMFVKMMGPYLIEEYRSLKYEHQLYKKLLEQLPKVDAFKQHFHYSVTNWLPFYWAGYQQTTRYSYLLDLQDIDQVQKGFNRNIRRNIKKAQQQLRVVHDLSIEDFYQLNKLSFDRQGIPIPYSFEQFRRHDEALAQHHARQLFFAVDENDRIHSASYLIWDKVSSYYHLSGDDPELRDSGAGILLIWKAIQFTKNQLGLSTFDFEGSMMKNVEAIRRQFGAKQVPYFSLSNYDSRLFWLLEKVRSGG